MKINTFQIENYKSFRETESIALSEGFNIIVSPNNFGKTALLELLSTRFDSKPHRTIKIPKSTPLNKKSSIYFSLHFSGDEFMDFLLKQNQPTIPVALDSQESVSDPESFIKQIWSINDVFLTCKITSSDVTVYSFENDFYSLNFDDGNCTSYRFNIKDDNSDLTFYRKVNSDPSLTSLANLVHYFGERNYYFIAERLNIGVCPFGASKTLSPDASNLAEVINSLQSNSFRFERLNDHIRSIFPNIEKVVARPAEGKGNQVELGVWTTDPSSERDDLVIELEESGTGVGQVLAILYVVITSEEPRVIIIDEPNTFLNPGAAKKLIEILKEYPHHQYIFSTHAPEIIRTCEPETMISVQWDDGESKLVPLDANSVEDMQTVLLDVGAKLSDVFGADEILWVEGQTEEACFPKILRKFDWQSRLGTAVVAVRTTGEFESKRANAEGIWEIYEKLSQSKALLPPAVAFVFDREGRTKKDMDDLSCRSADRLKFLPRRMYENYLLHPDAISGLLNSMPSFADSPIDQDEVEKWLLSHGGEKSYFKGEYELTDLEDENWLQEVDGAKLLKDLIAGLSDNKEEFRKRSHSVWLTEWLLENRPEAFLELAGFLDGVLDKEREAGSA